MITLNSAYNAEPIPESALEDINNLLKSGDLFRYTSDESLVSLLEKEFADYMGVKYALAVSSCSAGLHLSLEALALGDGARILVPAFTFAAVPSSIVNARMCPVLVEVNNNYRINLDDFKSKIKQNISAVMISHMRGHTSDMDEIMKICNELDIPVIEDAAHSLGTLWNGKKIGTIGKVGCFSFQSYKMINAGEGGIIISNDPNIIARAVIMSGAYEHNWKKHKINIELQRALEEWQNKLPLYNLRMQNLSAAVIRPQIRVLDRRITDGLRNYNYVANKLNQSKWLEVPNPLPLETRAPDSIQFNLINFDTDQDVECFQNAAKKLGINVQVFGLSKDNARAFWNWKFILGDKLNLPKTKAMLMRACDVRLPVWLSIEELDFIANAIIESANKAKNDNSTRT